MEDELCITPPYISQDKRNVKSHISTFRKAKIYALLSIRWILIIGIIYGAPINFIYKHANPEHHLILIIISFVVSSLMTYPLMKLILNDINYLPSIHINNIGMTYKLKDVNLQKIEGDVQWSNIEKASRYIPVADVSLWEVEKKTMHHKEVCRYLQLFKVDDANSNKTSKIAISLREISLFSNKKEIAQAVIANIAMHPHYNLSISENVFYYCNIDPHTLGYTKNPFGRTYFREFISPSAIIAFIVFSIISYHFNISILRGVSAVVAVIIIASIVVKLPPKIEGYFHRIPQLKRITYTRPHRS